MSSFYRSDTSNSAHDTRNASRSSVSVFGHPVEANQVTRQSGAIGNRAYDNTLQINGHVADKVSSYNIKYFIVGCHGCDVAKVMAGKGLALPFPAPVSSQPRLPAQAQHSGRFNIVNKGEIASFLNAKRYISIVSKRTEKAASVCVIYPRRVQDDFVSPKIVDRLGLEPRFDSGHVSSIVWDEERLTSTGGFVDVSFPLSGSDKGVVRRLHILENSPFDVLLGSPAVRSSFLRKQKPLPR